MCICLVPWLMIVDVNYLLYLSFLAVRLLDLFRFSLHACTESLPIQNDVYLFFTCTFKLVGILLILRTVELHGYTDLERC